MELKSKEKTEEKDQSEEYDYITVPPDGGYGWIVLLACFVSLSLDLDRRTSIFQLINLIVDGFLYAFGAFSDDIKKSYQCPEWAVSAVISLACGFYLLSGTCSPITPRPSDDFFFSSRRLGTVQQVRLSTRRNRRQHHRLGSDRHLHSLTEHLRHVAPLRLHRWYRPGSRLPAESRHGRLLLREVASHCDRSVAPILSFSQSSSCFRDRHGWNGHRLDHLRSSLSSPLRCPPMENRSSDSGRNSSHLCDLLRIHASVETHSKVSRRFADPCVSELERR